MKNVEDVYPLTPLQRSLLAHVLAAPRSAVGFEQSHCVLEGDLEPEVFLDAWRRTVQRHPILRTVFVSRGVREPLQVVRRSIELPVERQDWGDLADGEAGARLERYLAEDRAAGFDPARGPLFRLALFRLGRGRHAFVWSHHHLLLDGWCSAILLREIFTSYAAGLRGIVPALPPAIPFRRYVGWLQGRDEGRAEVFWRELFAGYEGGPTPLGLDLLPAPGDDPAGRPADERTGRHGGELPVGLTVEIHAFARRYGVTPNTLVQAAWALLLAKYSGRGDVVWGIGVSGRPADLPGADAILGMFINNLPVRARARGGDRVLPWLRGLQERLAELRQFEHSAAEQVQAWSGVPAGRRFFDSLVLFQNYPTGPPAPGASASSTEGLRITGYRSRLETGYALTVVAVPGKVLELRIHNDRRRISDPAAATLHRHLVTALRVLVEDPERRLSELPVEGSLGRGDSVGSLGGTDGGGAPGPGRASRPGAASLLPQGSGEAALDGGPDGTVLRDGSLTLRRRDLLRRVGELAARLGAAGVGPGSLVALVSGPVTRRLVAALALVERGAACAWIDPGGPLPEGARWRLVPAGESFGIEPVLASAEAPSEDRAGDLARRPTDGPAGSVPEGAWLLPIAAGPRSGWLVQSASAVRSRVDALRPVLDLGPGDEVWVEESEAVAADPALLLAAMAAGGCVVVAAEANPPEARDGVRRWRLASDAGWAQRWGRRLEERTGGVGAIETPERPLATGGRLHRGLLRVLAEGAGCGPEGNRGVALFEAVPRWLTAEIRPPSELSSGATLEAASAAAARSSAVVRSLDRWLRPVLPGAVGELFLEPPRVDGDEDGDGLPQGWWNDPRRTAADLLPHPQAARPGQRLWRCGWTARRLLDGTLEPSGPARGAGGGAEDRSASPAESAAAREARERCEMVLRRHPDLLWSRVVRPSALRASRIVACWVADPRRPPSAGEVRTFLAATLPAADLPSAYRALRAPLPAMGDFADESALERLAVHPEEGVVEPRSPEELRLVEIWERVFERRPIGVTEDFFQLGGHSLLAVRLVAEMEAAFGRKLPIAEILRGGSIEGLARRLANPVGDAPWSPLVPIREGGDGLPLFLVHPAGGSVFRYVALARHLGRQRKVYGLQARGHLEGQEALDRVEDLAALYLEAVRKVQPGGPYALGGWSFGGLVAYEMAQRLRAAGQQVAFLGMLDAAAGATAWEGYEGPQPDRVERWTRILGSGTLATEEELRQAAGDEERLTLLVERARRGGLLPEDFDLAAAQRYVATLDRHAEALRHYRPAPYAGAIHLFRAEAGLVTALGEPTLGWGGLASEVHVHPLPGSHAELLQSPRVELLAAALDAALGPADAALRHPASGGAATAGPGL